jgi:hypothetical protein
MEKALADNQTTVLIKISPESLNQLHERLQQGLSPERRTLLQEIFQRILNIFRRTH